MTTTTEDRDRSDALRRKTIDSMLAVNDIRMTLLTDPELSGIAAAWPVDRIRSLALKGSA